MNVASNIKNEFDGFIFLNRNLCAASLFSLSKISERDEKGFNIRGLNRKRITELRSLHQELRAGRKINFWRSILLNVHGNKLCSIITYANKRIAGFQLIYFREREWRNGIIHEAFIGIIPKFRGLGLSVLMRRHMVEHFKKNRKICGITSQVRQTDTISLRSAQKAGFVANAEAPQARKESSGILSLYCDLEQKRQGG